MLAGQGNVYGLALLLPFIEPNDESGANVDACVGHLTNQDSTCS